MLFRPGVCVHKKKPMWFIAHTGTPGCEDVISIDFDKELENLWRQQDPPTPAAFAHTLLLDSVILKWVTMHGDSAWVELAQAMGGPEHGWWPDLVQERYTSICRQLDTTPPPSRCTRSTPFCNERPPK